MARSANVIVLTLHKEIVKLRLLFRFGVWAMYAVIVSGGKQYRVAPGDVIRLEKLPAEEGSSVDFDRVLMVNDGESIKIGTPLVEGSTVSGKVKSQGRSKKVLILKFKRRKQYRKQRGHRQDYTEVEITAINS
jgi:large subunit ribosomal protein L21